MGNKMHCVGEWVSGWVGVTALRRIEVGLGSGQERSVVENDFRAR